MISHLEDLFGCNCCATTCLVRCQFFCQVRIQAHLFCIGGLFPALVAYCKEGATSGFTFSFPLQRGGDDVSALQGQEVSFQVSHWPIICTTPPPPYASGSRSLDKLAGEDSRFLHLRFVANVVYLKHGIFCACSFSAIDHQPPARFSHKAVMTTVENARGVNSRTCLSFNGT